jgi:hypothetical protein
VFYDGEVFLKCAVVYHNRLLIATGSTCVAATTLANSLNILMCFKALCYKPEGRGLDTLWGDFFF